MRYRSIDRSEPTYQDLPHGFDRRTHCALCRQPRRTHVCVQHAVAQLECGCYARRVAAQKFQRAHAACGAPPAAAA